MNSMRWKLSSGFLGAAVAAIATLGTHTIGTAFAIPMVYDCHVIDYTSSGVARSDFQYHVGGGGYLSFKSDKSEVRLNYDKQNSVLAISLRPLSDLESYARREDRGTPLEVSLTHAGPGYAATLRCKL